MKKEEIESPQAFPCALNGDEKSGWTPEYVEGMLLRDYFAAKALPKMISVIPRGFWNNVKRFLRLPYTGDIYSDEVSEACYLMADEMLKQRVK